jgi:hypothetical protein
MCTYIQADTTLQKPFRLIHGGLKYYVYEKVKLEKVIRNC